MRWSFDMDRKVFIFTRSRRSPLQGTFRWSFPRPEGLGCSVKPLRGKSDRSLAKLSGFEQSHSLDNSSLDRIDIQSKDLFGGSQERV